MPALRCRAITPSRNGTQNFASSSVFAVLYRSGSRMFEPGLQPDRLDLGWLNIVIGHELQHRVHTGMAEASARVRLHRHAGVHDRVRPAERANQPTGFGATTQHLKVSPASVEAVVACRKSLEASNAAVMPFSAARPAWSGLVIDPKFTRSPAARLAAMPMACAVCAASSLSNRAVAGRPGKRARRRGAVKPPPVVIGVDGFCDLALDLEAGEERIEKRRPARLLLLCYRERRCQGPARSDASEPVGAIGRRRQLRVVEIHGVTRKRRSPAPRKGGGAAIRSGPRIDATPSRS